MDTGFDYVGKRMPFVAAAEKATGQVKYSVDNYVPGARFGKLLTSPHAHARILGIDTSKAEALPGVDAVVTFADAPKIKINPSIQKWMHHHPAFDLEDMYVISDKARFKGDIIGAVSAVDEKTADEALGLIKVDYEVLPAVIDPHEAAKPGAPLIHEDLESNVSQEWAFPANRGDVEAACAEAAVVVEDRVRTSRQNLMALEPLTCTALWGAGGDLTIWTANQRPFTIRKQLAELFEMPEGGVNIICGYAGGFFGEGNWPVVPVAALLARKSGKAVRIEYPRETYVLETCTREVYDIYGKLAFAKDGFLQAGAIDLLVDSGAYFNRSNATTGPTMGAFQGQYRMPAAKCTMRAVYTNTPMTGGSRGYGGPQAVLMLEHLFDAAAERLGIDPIELRCMNMKRMGERAIQLPFETETQERVLRLAAEKAGYAEKRARPREEGALRRGIGMSNYMDVSGGQPGEIMDRHCVMNLEEDGTVTVTQSHPDGGMNLLGACTQIAAEALGMRCEDFRHVHDSTKGALYDMGLGANSGCYVMGNLYKKGAEEMKEKILEAASELFECAPEALDIKGSSIYMKDDPEKRMSVKDFADQIVYNHRGPSHHVTVRASFCPTENPAAVGTVFAEVCVDTQTGDIKVEKLLTVHDCGRAINPMGVEGQLQGAMITGFGYAMFEDLAIDVEGTVRADNFNKYKFTTSLDAPEMEVHLFEEDPPGSGPYGAKAAGMSGVVGIASAIANALYDATGVWLEEMPFTAERVLAALKKKEQKQQ
ncbi:MAG: xanthine dehydrogenase family protein molybdopterin-binding subunit [Clostridiales bacterium]|nr:xanthine dehydrogenase family protein molybdopterin-binding subunit [Clostridiales bacterium]